MTDTHSSISSMPKEAIKTVKPGASERAAVRELVKAARARGEDLAGPEGLLKAILPSVVAGACNCPTMGLLRHSSAFLVHTKECLALWTLQIVSPPRESPCRPHRRR